jgi:hypothetical protein
MQQAAVMMKVGWNGFKKQGIMASFPIFENLLDSLDFWRLFEFFGDFLNFLETY